MSTGPRIDLTGQTFGRLTVESFAGMSGGKHRRYQWLTVCECGEHCVVQGKALRAGNTQSCGIRASGWSDVDAVTVPVGARRETS